MGADMGAAADLDAWPDHRIGFDARAGADHRTLADHHPDAELDTVFQPHRRMDGGGALVAACTVEARGDARPRGLGRGGDQADAGFRHLIGEGFGHEDEFGPALAQLFEIAAVGEESGVALAGQARKRQRRAGFDEAAPLYARHSLPGKADRHHLIQIDF